MGFSVSGATAVILIGGLIAFSFAFTAASNGLEQVSEAQNDRDERTLAQQNTAIEIAGSTYDGTADELTVLVNNTGSAELTVNGTSLLVDGTYQSGVSTSVDGDGSTELWLPGEQLRLVVGATTQPARVKVVTETGVAATTTEVTTSG